MPNTLTGRIDRIGPTVQIPSKDGARQFTKRELTIDATRFDSYTGERGYDNFPTFEFSGERCAELDHYQPGQLVTVSFDLQGMKYTDRDGTTKYFTRVRGYKIEPKQMAAQPAQPTASQQPVYNQPAPPPPPPEMDSIPF